MLTEPRQRHVLIVDEAAEVRALVREMLEGAGHHVSVAAAAPMDPGHIRRVGAGIVVFDTGPRGEAPGWRRPPSREQDRAAACIPMVVCSGDTRIARDLADGLEARKIGPLSNPFAIADLLRVVEDRMGPPSATN